MQNTSLRRHRVKSAQRGKAGLVGEALVGQAQAKSAFRGIVASARVDLLGPVSAEKEPGCTHG